MVLCSQNIDPSHESTEAKILAEAEVEYDWPKPKPKLKPKFYEFS